MKKIIAQFLVFAIATSLMIGCANTDSFLKAIGTPESIQYDLTVLGAIAKPHITDPNVLAQIHKFATDLQQVGNLDASQLVALIPHTGNPEAEALISAAVGYLNSVIAKFGSHNPTTLAYIKAVANGVLVNY